MKKINRKKFLQFVVLILFFTALIVPQNANRGIIAGIALIGISIALLSFVLPLFAEQIKSRKRRNQTHTARTCYPEVKPDLEALLWRQIKFQITGKLKETFPDAIWDFVKEPQLSKILDGESIRIRTRNTGTYHFAEVLMDTRGFLTLQMMTIEALHRYEPSDENPESQSAINPKFWYSLIGKPALMELIGDLQARDYEKLYINEQGDVYIMNGTELEVRGTLEHFPPKGYWSELADIFTEDELNTEETEQALEVSWLS